MLRTYASCEPILAYIRNDLACDPAKSKMLHQHTASETMQGNDNGSCFVEYSSSSGWWCEINPSTEDS
jgi:hypothetical protein